MSKSSVNSSTQMQEPADISHTQPASQAGKSSMQSSASEVETNASVVSRPWVSKDMSAGGALPEEDALTPTAAKTTAAADKLANPRRRSTLETFFTNWQDKLKANVGKWRKKPAQPC